MCGIGSEAEKVMCDPPHIFARRADATCDSRREISLDRPTESGMSTGAGHGTGDGMKHGTKRQVSGFATAYLVIYNVVLCSG